MNKIKRSVSFYYALLITICTNYLFIIKTYATEATEGNLGMVAETQSMNAGNGEGGAADEFKDFLAGENGLMNLVSHAGLVLIAFGIGQLILAFKDDNPEAKSRGVMILLGGVFCVTISTILTSLGVHI
ncbi:hypothetical protein [Lacrimispora amygdalina]|uniref:hypothetical protein n=1 Tax=Lacrimispora amygdalina TaxID=253257 RepID=UPI000BE3E29C|nr:hypothetical protein [Lacrimispora amygdalina]